MLQRRSDSCSHLMSGGHMDELHSHVVKDVELRVPAGQSRYSTTEIFGRLAI